MKESSYQVGCDLRQDCSGFYMRNILPKTLDALISGTYRYFLPGTPGAGTVGGIGSALANKLIENRIELAFDELLTELRRGQYPTRSEAEVSEVLSMMLRYQRAAIEGAAIINLRLMARVFCGLASDRPLVADEFQSWADTLQGLRRLEVIAIAEVHKYTIDVADSPPCNNLGSRSDKFVVGLIPKPFRNEAELLAICQAASRTGLLIGQDDYNLFPYKSTPLMIELENLCGFQDIVRTMRQDDK